MRILLTTSLRPEMVKVWVCQETSPGGSMLPPVDLASVAAVAREAGAEVRLADLRLAKDPAAAFREVLEQFKPDAILLNLTTTSAAGDYEMLATVPREVKRICFGTHAQSMRDEAFEKGVDIVLLGDPEAGIQGLIREGFAKADTLPGVLTASARQKPPLEWKDLNAMPYPALDLLELDRYHAPYIRRGQRFTLMLSGRGCPFKCTYCLYPVLFGETARLRTAKSVVDEVEHNLRVHGIRDFYFLDATFNLGARKVTEFCEEIIRRGLDVGWSCNMRVSPAPLEMLQLMKKAGCRWIFFGVEDQEFLKETLKGTTQNSTLDAFRKAKDAGIPTMAFTMVFPRDGVTETQYVEQTLSTLKVLEADAFQCNVAIPFPGTALYDDYAKANPDLSRDWKLYDPHGEIMPYRHEQDLVRIKRRVYRGFLLRHPWRVLRVVSRMGPKALLSLAWTFLRENLRPRVRRAS